MDFTAGLSGQYGGSSPLAAAFEEAFSSEAGAIILISDGLPNPAFNKSLPPSALVRDITLNNTAGKEIHAVTIGDYFKYRGTVQFMESLARANSGGFLALAQ
jgi:Mg-chelatase subunit ChlD